MKHKIIFQVSINDKSELIYAKTPLTVLEDNALHNFLRLFIKDMDKQAQIDYLSDLEELEDD